MVSLQLPNIAEFLIAYLAIARLGAVMSTMHCAYRTAEMSTLLKHNRSRAFIGMSRLKDFQPAAEVVMMRRELPVLDHVIALGEPVAGAVSFSNCCWLIAAFLATSARSLPTPSCCCSRRGRAPARRRCRSPIR